MPERFMVVPFWNGWKVLDFTVGRFVRLYDTERAANRYVHARNRRAGTLPPPKPPRPLCSRPCECRRFNARSFNNRHED